MKKVLAIIIKICYSISVAKNVYGYRGIAQLVEQRSPKPRAEGSSPSAPAIS